MADRESDPMGALRPDEPLPEDGDQPDSSADADRAAGYGQPTDGAEGDPRPQSAEADREAASGD